MKTNDVTSRDAIVGGTTSYHAEDCGVSEKEEHTYRQSSKTERAITYQQNTIRGLRLGLIFANTLIYTCRLNRLNCVIVHVDTIYYESPK